MYILYTHQNFYLKRADFLKVVKCPIEATLNSHKHIINYILSPES